MCRIKKLSAFLLALSVVLFLPGKSFASELIPEEQIIEDSANYETAEAFYGDMTVSAYSSGFSFLSVDYKMVYKGEDVLYLETLVAANDLVEEGDPLFRIQTSVDTVAIAEKELRIKRIQEELQRGRDERAKAIQEIKKKKWEGDAYQRKRTQLNLDKMDVELQRYVYEQERSIRILQEELEEMNEKAAQEYIYSPYSGSVTNIQYFTENSTITNGDVLMEIKGETTLLAKSSATFRYGADIIFDASSVGLGKFSGKAIVAENAMPDSDLKGTIIAIDVDESTQKNLINRINNATGRDLSFALRSVNIEGIGVDLKNVLLIPASAREIDSGKDYVSVLGDDNMVHRRLIVSGAASKDYIWVLQGLEEGDKVVIK